MQDASSPSPFSQRSTIVTLGVLIVGIVALFLPMMVHWQVAGDYTTHNDIAAGVLNDPAEFYRNVTHFIYNVSVALADVLLPSDVNTAAAWVMVACYVGLGVLIFWELLSRTGIGTGWQGQVLLAGISILLLLIAPIFFFTGQNLYFGYFAPHVYHNPTVNIMKPFSVALFFVSVPLFLNSQPLSRWWIAPLALLTFLSLVAKPSFVLAFVPTLGLLTFALIVYRFGDVWQIIKRPLTLWQTFTFRDPEDTKELPVLLRPTYINWSVLLGGIVIPSIAILLIQTITWTSSGGIGIDPFRVFFEWTLHYEPNADKQIALKFVMSAGLPLVVYALFVRDAVQSLLFNLAWLFYIVAALYAYLFVDYTVIAAGDFTWSSQIASLILQIVAVIFGLARVRERYIRDGWSASLVAKTVASTVVFGLHVGAGIFWYYLHITQTFSDLIYVWW
ncbi:MAG: hypothetical protein AAF126_12430 [Chloroflexota bacterium]